MSEAKRKKSIISVLVVAVMCAVFVWIAFRIFPPTDEEQGSKKEVITVSTLEKIINVSELSALTAVYNGVAQVMNEEAPDEVDYYVSYEAKVNAGIDFEKVGISVDDTEMLVKITIPDIYITEINVDIASLDYIFINDSANTSSVSKEAFKACEDDVKNESEKQETIFELARQNAKNILTALTRPFIEQTGEGYTLIIE